MARHSIGKSWSETNIKYNGVEALSRDYQLVGTAYHSQPSRNPRFHRFDWQRRSINVSSTGQIKSYMQNGTFWELLSEGAQRIGIPIDSDQIERFRLYTDLLIESNAQFNLTAIREIPEIITKIHLDSLSLVPAIASAAGLETIDLLSKPWKCADVGAGAGIPGIPLNLIWPSLSLTLIESQNKKSKFLTRVIFLLDLRSQIISQRVEDAGQSPRERETYDLVVARAVAGLDTLVEYTLPLAKVGGIVALAKGPKAGQELEQARFAVELLGGELLGIETLIAPFQKETRTVVLLRKTRPTPSEYPRRSGIPGKRPLRPHEGY